MRSPLLQFVAMSLLLALLPLAGCRIWEGYPVRGYAVKGPLAFADVTAFEVDGAAPGMEGPELDTGTTTARARTQNLRIPESYSGAVLLEYTAKANTVDLNTGEAPLIPTLRTLVDSQRVQDEELIFATPLTTLAIDIAAESADADGDGDVSEAELDAALADAAELVASTVGFGLLDGVDIFDTPALLTAETDTPEAQEAVARYRMASEALSAVVVALLSESGGSDADVILEGLAQDLSDEVIDGLRDGAPVAAFEDIADPVAVIQQDPSGLYVPGTDVLVSDVATLLVGEMGDTGVDVPTEALTGIVLEPAPVVSGTDSDADGIRDTLDNCPDIPNPAQEPALWGEFAWGGDCWQ